MKNTSRESIKKFKTGEIVFHEGDTSTEMYLIISGQAEVLKKINDDEIQLSVLSVGDFFGEMAMFGGGARSASVKAIDNLETIVVSENEFRNQFENLPEWFGNMFEELTNRLRMMDERIVAQFKAGIEFSILNMFHLLAEQYGTHAGKKLTVDKKFAVDKTHYILGVSVGEILKHMEDFLQTGVIELEKGTGKILIKDKKELEHFIDFYQCRIDTEDIEEISRLLPHLKKEKLEIFNKKYKTIYRPSSHQYSILKT